jgi:hypothetical protein
MGNVQVGGKVPKGGGGRTRIERPFVGVIAGLSINRLRVLDLAAERDPLITMRGDAQLVTGVLDRSNDLQTRMQQVRFLNERQFIKYMIYKKDMQLQLLYNMPAMIKERYATCFFPQIFKFESPLFLHRNRFCYKLHFFTSCL